MKVVALLSVIIAAALCNVVLTGFAQSAAYRSYELVQRDSSRYSDVGSVVVPLAADSTSLQLAACALPLIIGVVACWRRWPLSVSLALIVAFELFVFAWCAMAFEFARMPFTVG